MGSTVTTNQIASACQVQGDTVYALWEETYEKNCHPGTLSRRRKTGRTGADAHPMRLPEQRIDQNCC